MNCDISVVIPVYNGKKFLFQSISSALSQDITGVEVIVVDDGSTDETLEVARTFGDSIKLLSQSNQGACAARNLGISTARGRYIKFLDADDYLFPGALKAQYAHALKLLPNQFSYGRTIRHIEADGLLVPHSPRDARTNNRDELDALLIDPPVTSAILYPALLLEELSGFDIKLIKRQDYDLFARALLAGYIPVECPEPIYAYRSHEDENRISYRSSREAFANQFEMFQRQCELLKLAGVTRDVQKLRAGLARTIWITARNCLRNGYLEEAKKMFELSNSLDGWKGWEGKLIYKIFVRLFGPLNAERVIEKAKSLRT